MKLRARIDTCGSHSLNGCAAGHKRHKIQSTDHTRVEDICANVILGKGVDKDAIEEEEEEEEDDDDAFE